MKSLLVWLKLALQLCNDCRWLLVSSLKRCLDTLSLCTIHRWDAWRQTQVFVHTHCNTNILRHCRQLNTQTHTIILTAIIYRISRSVLTTLQSLCSLVSCHCKLMLIWSFLGLPELANNTSNISKKPHGNCQNNTYCRPDTLPDACLTALRVTYATKLLVSYIQI